jgi:hypothetical protein
MSTPESTAPLPAEYAPYHVKYISLVPEGDIIATLGRQLEELLSLLRGLPDDRAVLRQPPYTWSIKEVVGHVVDAERVFAYRAMRFARNDATPLPGFEQDDYVRSANFDAVPLANLVSEWEHVRRANICFFRNLDPDAWLRHGRASDNNVSVRALAYIMAGHERHHTEILRKRVREFS